MFTEYKYELLGLLAAAGFLFVLVVFLESYSNKLHPPPTHKSDQAYYYELERRHINLCNSLQPPTKEVKENNNGQ